MAPAPIDSSKQRRVLATRRPWPESSLTWTALQNESPGPGSYHTATDHRLHDAKIYSSKGLGGGFVSKTKRESAFGKGSVAPAPGAYESKGTFRTTDGHHFSGSTSAFKPPSQRAVAPAIWSLIGRQQTVNTHTHTHC